MKRPMQACAVLILAGGGTSALAARPRCDVEAPRDAMAGFGGTYSHDMYDFCIESEQSAYDGLKAVWGAIPPGVQIHCDAVAQFAGPGSYDMLAACIRDGMQAADSRPTFED